MALYETVMVKGYESLADPDTQVDVNTAMIAAGRLQALIDTRAGQPDMVDMRVKVNRIIDAVRSMAGVVMARTPATDRRRYISRSAASANLGLGRQ
jgi:hypothetical protein